jgi:hypothetical protein
MAYIGKTPVLGNFVKLDAISVVNGQASYTMQNGGVNFTSYDNVNQFLVSLNGILQSPTDSFTVSGSTLTFASNLSTGDVIDFVMVLGNTLDIGTPSDNTVSTAKIVDGAVTYAKASGFGKLLQVVSGTTSTRVQNNTATYADTGLTVNITPSATSSKIIIMGTQADVFKNNGNSANSVHLRLVRNSTEILDIADRAFLTASALENMGNVSFHHLDSPSSTSELTYKTQFHNHSSVEFAAVQQQGAGKSTIIAMEIAG